MIIPAILENSVEDFEQRLLDVKNIKPKVVQIDFIDGIFVKGKTINVQQINKLPAGIKFEAHLMVESPTDFVIYQQKGFSKIIIHYESFDSEKEMESAMHVITKLGMDVAIAINPKTPVSILSYDTDTVFNFTILSVTPGKQGQKFLLSSKKKIKELRKLAPKAKIEVDGGITLKNISKVIKAGADDCVVGSGIFGTGDPKQNYQDFIKTIK